MMWWALCAVCNGRGLKGNVMLLVDGLKIGIDIGR